MIRIRIESTTPPKNPAIPPITRPTERPMPTATRPISNV